MTDASSSRRLFFALNLSEQDKTDVAAWRSKNLPADLGRAVKQDNFHLTLLFLGNVLASEIPYLVNCVDVSKEKLDPQLSFVITLDRLGYFRRSRCLWLGDSNGSAGFIALHKLLKEQMLSSSLTLDEMDERATFYTPHITLFRKARNIQKTVETPQLQMEFESFQLLSSELTDSGVCYRSLHQWSL